MHAEHVRILIIEDDEIQQRLLKKMLLDLKSVSQYKFHIKIVSSGKKGLSLAIEWMPMILILDIHLPDLHGYDILKQLKINNLLDNDIMVLLSTSDTSRETAIRGLASGAIDIIFKPTRSIELALKIAHLLNIRESQQKLHMANIQLEKEKESLSRFFSNDLMEQILKKKDFAEIGGIDTYATMLFFDLRGSTSMAEYLGPVKFADLLSKVLENVTNIIYKNFGSVNKFLGDGILATFGTPVVYSNDALHSIQCAIEILQYLDDFNRNLPDYMVSDIAAGIGIATGKVFAGNIGSKHRMEYTVLGDPVNIASRLQSLTKENDSDILIDENTFIETSDYVIAEKNDFSHIRGRMGELQIFSVIKINDEKVNALESNADKIDTDSAGDVEFF